MHSSSKTPFFMGATALLGWLAIAALGGAPRPAGAAKRDQSASPPAADAASDREPIDPERLGFDEIVFVKRKPYSSNHYYTDINNGTAGDRFVPENGIYIYNLRTRKERPWPASTSTPC